MITLLSALTRYFQRSRHQLVSTLTAQRKEKRLRRCLRKQAKPPMALEALEDRLTPSHVTYHGGPTIDNVVIQPIFYGSAWQTNPAPQARFHGNMSPKVTGTDSSPGGTTLLTVSNNLTRFLSNLVASPYMATLAQAGPNGTPYTASPRGTVAQTNGLAGPLPWQDYIPAALGSSVTDSDIQKAIDVEIKSFRTVPPSKSNLYFVFLPPGVSVSDVTGVTGYHSIDANGNYYAVIFYGNTATPAKTKGLTDFQKMTVTASHELVESVTDPTGDYHFINFGNPGDSTTNKDPNSISEAVVFTGGWYDDSDAALIGILVPAQTAFGRIVVPAYVIHNPPGTPEFMFNEIGDIPQFLTSVNPEGTGDCGTFDGYTVQYYFMDTFVTGSENFDGSGSFTTHHDVSALRSHVIGFSATGQPINGDFEVTNILTPTEGSFSGVIGSFYDGSLASTNYTATVDWGDGTTSTVVTQAAGDIQGNHDYAARAGTKVTIRIFVQDDRGHVTQLTRDVTLRDAPLTAVPRTVTEAKEGQVLQNALVGSFTDPGNIDGSTSEFTATVTWDDGGRTSHTAGATIRAHDGSRGVFDVYSSNAVPYAEAGDYSVDIVVQDVGGSTVTIPSAVKVQDVPPTASISGPSDGVRGQERDFTLTAKDASPKDRAAGYNYSIDWGDGSPVQTIAATANNGSGVSVGHVFTSEGDYTVKVTATGADDGLPSEVVSQKVHVTPYAFQPDPIYPGKTMLVIGGTTGDDLIQVIELPFPTPQIGIMINGQLDFVSEPSSRIVVYTQAGNDFVDATPTITPVWIFAGDGNDVLVGGQGNDVLVGGKGNDFLYAGAGRNLLIGGRGADTIFAPLSDDIVIGGYTSFDDNPAALAAIMAEWTSQSDYATRIAHLRGDLPGGMNGSIFLKSKGPDATVFGNQAADVLIVGPSLSWIFATLEGPFAASLPFRWPFQVVEDLGSGQNGATPLQSNTPVGSGFGIQSAAASAIGNQANWNFAGLDNAFADPLVGQRPSQSLDAMHPAS
jgi:hypothetical protein